MKIINWKTVASAQASSRQIMPEPVAVTIGVFDGVHIGHRALIENTASDSGMVPVVVTFRNNPQSILSPDSYTGDILTLDQKIERLKKLGIKIVVLIDFSVKFSKITAKTFFKYLVAAFNIKKIVVGKYFGFGRHKEGGVTTLKNLADIHDYCLTLVPPVYYHEHRVSSTRVRNAIADGNLPDAEQMLGEKFVLYLKGIMPGKTTGNMIVYSRDRLFQVIPSCGVYIGGVAGSAGLLKVTIEINDNELCIKHHHGLDHTEIESLVFMYE